jgi:hypothetical protein
MSNIAMPVCLHVGTNRLDLGEISGADHRELSRNLAALMHATGDALEQARAEAEQREQVPA